MGVGGEGERGCFQMFPSAVAKKWCRGALGWGKGRGYNSRGGERV